MESEPEKAGEPENEMMELFPENKDPNDEKKDEEYIEIDMTSTNPKREDRKRPKACDEEPYIVKLFKSLMNPQESQGSPEKKKKK